MISHWKSHCTGYKNCRGFQLFLASKNAFWKKVITVFCIRRIFSWHLFNIFSVWSYFHCLGPTVSTSTVVKIARFFCRRRFDFVIICINTLGFDEEVFLTVLASLVLSHLPMAYRLGIVDFLQEEQRSVHIWSVHRSLAIQNFGSERDSFIFEAAAL